MNTPEVYQLYCAIKAHFESGVKGYDYFKYQGKIKCGDVDKRNDKHMFFRLSRQLNDEQLKDFFVANLVVGTGWIGNMTQDAVAEWKKKVVRLTEVLEKDVKTLIAICDTEKIQVDELFKIHKGSHPRIVQLLMGSFITIESFIILNMHIKFLSVYDTEMSGDFIWKSLSDKVRKYTPFLQEKLNGYPAGCFAVILKKYLLNNT